MGKKCITLRTGKAGKLGEADKLHQLPNSASKLPWIQFACLRKQEKKEMLFHHG